MTRPGLLLVDDEEGIRTVLSVLLEDMGYAVKTASSGQEALVFYLRERPDIVMTDIKMPGMDGIDLLQSIKSRNADAEVIMLTGHGDMDLAVTSLRHGAGDFLNKPVSEAALEVALERAGRRIALREALRRHTEELELLVAEKTRDLILSERFAAVGEAAAGLAHSIKNIAGALEGTMYVLEKGLELNKREYFEEGWQMIRSDLNRLRALAVDMLDLGRKRELIFAPVPPARPATEVIELASSKASEAGVTLELKDASGAGPFTMAEEAVHQCLLNLVLNGIEAFPQGGAAPGEQQADCKERRLVRIAIIRERLPGGDEKIVYAVTDNGPGMEQARFGDNAFSSAKHGGSGIGLFSTRKIAHEMGSELRYSSESGRGTEALLCLAPQAPR